MRREGSLEKDKWDLQKTRKSEATHKLKIKSDGSQEK